MLRPPFGVYLALGSTKAVMKKSTVAIVLLSVALVGSNIWWAYGALDAGITYTYQQDSLQRSQEALKQSLAVIKASGQGATKDAVLAAAISSAEGVTEPFEKEGYIWVGSIGLRFSEGGHLKEAIPSWSPFP